MGSHELGMSSGKFFSQQDEVLGMLFDSEVLTSQLKLPLQVVITAYPSLFKCAGKFVLVLTPLIYQFGMQLLHFLISVTPSQRLTSSNSLTLAEAPAS